MTLRALSLILPLILSAPSLAAELELRRTGSSYDKGDPIWLLQLRDGGHVQQQWQAVASAKRHQQLDRRWSPGNGSPLPKGTYRVGAPEPWGQNRSPQFLCKLLPKSPPGDPMVV